MSRPASHVPSAESLSDETKAPRRTLATRLADRGLHHAAALALVAETESNFADEVRAALADEDAANALKVKAVVLAARALNVEVEANAAVEKAAKSRPVLDRLDAAAKKIAEIRAG